MTPDVPIPDVETIRKEKKPFAHFQWNYGWGHWEQVIEEAAGHDGVFAAYLAPCDHDNKLERLSAENARLHKRTTELEKRAGTAERNLRHVTEACEELRVNANEGWRQYGLCAEQNFVLEPINARLRKALQDILEIYGDDLPGKMARAALAETEDK